MDRNMLPILLNLKFVKIYTFGVFLMLAFFWGSYLLWKLVRLTSHKEEEIFDGLFYCLFGSLFFGRLIYVIFNFKDFGFNILKFILVNGYPGFSVYGLLAGGFIAFTLFCYIKKIKYIELVDYWISPLFLSIAIIKLGSFFSGAEVGVKTKFPIAVKYAGYDGLRHPVAFYESILFFIGAYLSYKLILAIRKEKYPTGFAFKFFVLYTGLIFLLFDKLKVNHLYFKGQNFNLYFSLLLVLTMTVYFVYHFKSLIIDSIKTYGQKAFKTTLGRIKRNPFKGNHKNKSKN